MKDRTPHGLNQAALWQSVNIEMTTAGLEYSEDYQSYYRQRALNHVS